MSCYEWESGTIQLSCAAFPTVLKAVQQAQTAYNERRHQTALDIYDRVVKLKVNPNTVEDVYYGRATTSELRDLVRIIGDDNMDLLHHMFQGENGKQRTTPLKPRKKDFPAANGATLDFGSGECGSSFDRKKRTVSWHVSENNHACEWAERTWLHKALFSALHSVQWTRGTGGVIVGNDEYHRDSQAPGGGGNYVKQRFGPLGEKAREW